MATQFGEMLMNRRRQMGLSIQQVANIIKIRPQIIEYFETGDFASMPLRGYATGMITSYARFLNLNPREVMNAYLRELEAFEHSTSHSGGRLSGPAGDVTTRSAAETGRFMMVNTPPRSRYAQRPPQAGYVSESVSSHHPGTGDAPVYGRREVSGGYRGPAARTGSQQGRVRRDPAAAGRGGSDRRDLARSRTRGSAQRPSGRTAYDQRRPSGSRSGYGSQRRRPGAAAPSLGIDPRIIVGGLVLLGIIIVLLAMLLMRGCSTSPTPAGSSSDAAAAVSDSGSSPKETSDDGGTDTADESEGGSSAADSGADGADGAQAAEQTVVKITVAKGETSWLEVRLDGQTVYGNEVVGPFEQEYTVTDSIRITSNTPSSVNVTLNGETVRWDTSTSGVARISITAPEPSGGDASDSTAASDGADAASADGASSDDQSQGASSVSAGGTE